MEALKQQFATKKDVKKEIDFQTLVTCATFLLDE